MREDWSKTAAAAQHQYGVTVVLSISPSLVGFNSAAARAQQGVLMSLRKHSSILEALGKQCILAKDDMSSVFTLHMRPLDHKHQQNFWWQHRPGTSTWPTATVQIVDINMPNGNSIDCGHQHAQRQQYRLWTSTWPPAAARTMEVFRGDLIQKMNNSSSWISYYSKSQGSRVVGQHIWTESSIVLYNHPCTQCC
ncbi:hypothetical protein STEG23_019249, partial [Scotinomys teguina]